MEILVTFSGFMIFMILLVLFVLKKEYKSEESVTSENHYHSQIKWLSIGLVFFSISLIIGMLIL